MGYAALKTFVALFASSSVFGLTIAVVYWFSSHERAGTFLLGFMFLALAFAAGYSYLSERNANLAGDDENVTPHDRAGEDLGIVTKSTPWPILLAFSIFILVLGTIWSDFLLFAGLGAALLCLWRLGAESARTGYKHIETEEGPENVT